MKSKLFVDIITIMGLILFWVFEILIRMSNHIVGYYNILLYFVLFYFSVILFFTKKSTWKYILNQGKGGFIFLNIIAFTTIFFIFIFLNTFITDKNFYPKNFTIQKKTTCNPMSKTLTKRYYCFDLQSKGDSVLFKVSDADNYKYDKDDNVTVFVEKSFLGFEIIKHYDINQLEFKYKVQSLENLISETSVGNEASDTEDKTKK